MTIEKTSEEILFNPIFNENEIYTVDGVYGIDSHTNFLCYKTRCNMVDIIKIYGKMVDKNKSKIYNLTDDDIILADKIRVKYSVFGEKYKSWIQVCDSKSSKIISELSSKVILFEPVFYNNEEYVQGVDNHNKFLCYKTRCEIIIYGKIDNGVKRELTRGEKLIAYKIIDSEKYKHLQIQLSSSWTTIYIYCRVSTYQQENSLKSQENRIRNFIYNAKNTNGYSIEKIFNIYPVINKDEFFRDEYDRPYYNIKVVNDICSINRCLSGQLISLLKIKDCIIISDDSDRLSRSTWACDKIINYVGENNIRLMTVDRSTSQSSDFWTCIDSYSGSPYNKNWENRFREQVLWAERDNEKRGMRRMGVKTYED